MDEFPNYGTWGSTDSRAVFRVRAGKAPETPQVDGWDSADGEWFKITGVKWDGKRLRFASTMPSTSWVVRHTWRVVDADTLEGERSTTDRPYRLTRSAAKPSK
ncbi:MAG: hypothetical protein H6702_22080 [Myxococcales bacterium]|nr:hypothetical protein [Myxococcales bacterium]